MPLSRVLARDLPRYFLKEEVHRVLEAAASRPFDHLLISFLWQTGCRVSEALAVRLKDVDFRLKQVILRTLKRTRGYQERALPLKGDLLGQIASSALERRLTPEDRIFPITRQRAHQIVKKHVLAAGFDQDRAHPHVFRHSFAVHCVLNGVPILVLKEWLGHADINSTLVYLKILGSDTRRFYEALNF